jgi:hypothetical protein
MKLWKRLILIPGVFVGTLAAFWTVIEVMNFFEHPLAQTIRTWNHGAGLWILLALSALLALLSPHILSESIVSAKILKPLASAIKWLIRQWRYILLAVLLISLELALYRLGGLKLVALSIAHLALVTLAILLLFAPQRATAALPDFTGDSRFLVFHDVFDSFDGWQDYLRGKVSQSTDITPRVGQYTLKKSDNNDPNGGWKEIGRSVGPGFAFSGWIYRPVKQGGGQADRLAIEDSRNNGYGFAVDRARNTAYIERRDIGEPTRLDPEVPLDNPFVNQWYQFKFCAKAGGWFELCLYVSDKEIKVSGVLDQQYSSFDRIVVHGGFPYYVDDLRIDAL